MNTPPPAARSPGIDVRDAFFDEVCRAAFADSRVIVLTDDQGAMSLNQLRQDRPAQYINLGIAEQNAIDVAAGLALGGMRPIVYGITNFVSLRCAEQIAVNLSLMNLPVTIVASGGGLTYASDGPTHHGTQDIAILRTMPRMSIYNPADAESTAAAARLTLASAGPSYVRMEKGVLPALYSPGFDFKPGFARLLAGDDVLIVSTGFVTHAALQAAGELQRQGIAAGVLDLFRLKPVNWEQLQPVLRAAGRIAVLEEQSPIGGVFSLLAEGLARDGMTAPLLQFCLPDEPCFKYGSREWLHAQYSLQTPALVSAIQEALRRDSGGAGRTEARSERKPR